MISVDDATVRHMIPRWQSLNTAINQGELESGSEVGKPTQHKQRINSEALKHEFAKKKQDWIRSSSLDDAQEVIGTAVIAGEQSDRIAIEAATQIITSKDCQIEVKEFAQTFLQNSDPTTDLTLLKEVQARREISHRKRLLLLNPRDGLNLAEMALLYANLGQLRQSEEFLGRSVALLPDNRYVLRANARFYAHMGEPDRSVEILRSSNSVKEDPWLAAALLASEALADVPIQNWKALKRLLKDDNFSQLGLSELAGEAATIELESGARKNARRFFKKSLLKPTENAIAQVEWANRKSNLFDSEEINVDFSKSFEAHSKELFYERKIKESLNKSALWLNMEPFSVSPAVFATFVASIFPRYASMGIEIARAAKKNHLIDNSLNNNMAVLHAYIGKIEEAKKYAKEHRKSMGNSSTDITGIATEGLISFREGNIEKGCQSYLRAINAATIPELAFRAMCFFARELKRTKQSLAAPLIERINKELESAKNKNLTIPKDIDMIHQELTSRPIIEIENKTGVSVDLSQISLDFT